MKNTHFTIYGEKTLFHGNEAPSYTEGMKKLEIISHLAAPPQNLSVKSR